VILDHPDRIGRMNTTIGDSLRPLYKALQEYYEGRDRAEHTPIVTTKDDIEEDEEAEE
jgi:hypothetical protein